MNFEKAEKLRINNFQFRIKSWSLQVLDLAAFVKLLPLQSNVKFAKSCFTATKNVKPNIQKIKDQIFWKNIKRGNITGKWSRIVEALIGVVHALSCSVNTSG